MFDKTRFKEEVMGKKNSALTFIGTLQFLSQFFGNLYHRFLLFYIGRLVTMLEEILVPILIGIMINQIVYYKNFSVFLQISAVFLFVCVVSCVIYYFAYGIYSDFWARILERVRVKIYSHVLQMEAEQMANANYGDLAQQIQWKAMECVQFVVRNIIHNINNILYIVICLFIVFQINPIIGGVFVVMVPISGFVSWRYGKKIRIERGRNQESYGNYISWLYEVFASFKDLRLLGAENRIKSKFLYYQKDLINTDIKAGVAALIAQNIIVNVNVWIQMILYIVLALLAIEKNLSIGSVMVVLAYFSSLTNCLKMVCENYMDAQNRMSIIQRLKDIIELPLEKDSSGAESLTVKEANVQFTDVSFAYRHKKCVLNNFSMTLQVGEKIAVVGESGCGKSTLAYMLLGFYRPQSGEILIDGKPIQQYTLSSLRENIGIVQQDVLIFDGTVRENIMIGRTNASEDDMIQACKAAGVYDFVMEMDDQFDTKLGRNARKLSGGQKQRIAIARVYLKNPSILIFDEATASLDKETEGQIHMNWEKVLQGRTAIIIAHRQSSVMLCDRVAIMQNGRIIEEGKPEQMEKESAAFRTLFAIQEVEK